MAHGHDDGAGNEDRRAGGTRSGASTLTAAARVAGGRRPARRSECRTPDYGIDGLSTETAMASR